MYVRIVYVCTYEHKLALMSLMYECHVSVAFM